MSSLKAIAEAVWGLLVEDGSLAVGIIVALGVTWLAAAVLPEPALDQVGWLLLALLIALLIVNLRQAGRRASRQVSAGH